MSLSDLASNLAATMPMNIVILWACVLLLVDVFISGERKGWTALLAAIGLAAALLASLAQAGRELVVFNGMVVVDSFATFLNLLFLGSGLVGIALAYDYLKRMRIDRGEYYVLLLFSISGMMLMAVAADLIVVFLALELLSFPLYVLAGFARPRADSEESALKYFLLGAFSSSFVVYGIALVFGATGATGLEQIVTAVSAGTSNSVLLTFGAALILIGLGFKVGAVPFHMWTPDVYQGAPSSVTAFMAVGAKAGGFAAMLLCLFLGILFGLAAGRLCLWPHLRPGAGAGRAGGPVADAGRQERGVPGQGGQDPGGRSGAEHEGEGHQPLNSFYHKR